jgi:antitoxin PrlF
MPTSILTEKGQTTLPKEIRKLLDLKAGDKILYNIMDRDKVIISPVKSDIIELFGSVKHRTGRLDFAKLRAKTRSFVAAKITGKDR